MKACIIGFALLFTASLAVGITVTGVALLENETNHSNIRVEFNAVSPSAVTDSIHTNTNGGFGIELVTGVYHVVYSKIGFETFILENIAFLQNTTLATVTLTDLANTLSGSLSGSVGPGLYRAVDDIYVEANDTLTILPGTRIEFVWPFGFGINGHLTAEGTEEDSIVFTSYENRWNGIVFYESSSTAISYADISNVEVYENSSGGIGCFYSQVAFANCFIHDNFSDGIGGGILISGGTAELNDCVIAGNESQAYGGGILADQDCTARITSCDIVENHSNTGGGVCIGAGATVTLRECNISCNHAFFGGGVYSQWSTATGSIEDCTISDNEALHSGAGVYGDGMQSISLYRCEINANSAGYVGGCLLTDTDMLLHSCEIAGNTSGVLSPYSVSIGGGSPRLINCTIRSNPVTDSAAVRLHFATTTISSSIINSSRSAILFEDSPNSLIKFCNIYSSDGEFFTNENQGPVIIGLLLTVNNNGDSSDTYYNIFEEPLFVDAENGNFHLLEDSPCIDAGDPDSPLDPDGTIADIGAYYFPQTQPVDVPQAVIPSELKLYQNFPNPFNAETSISFDLQESGLVHLNIFNLLGQRIATLANHRLNSGHHTIHFNAARLPSGLYIYRLETNGNISQRKMILLK